MCPSFFCYNVGMKLAVQLVRMNMTEKQLFAIVFGVMIGFFVALVIAYFLFPLTGQVDPKFMAGVVDTHHQICPELREANFYRLCVIFGFCFGMVGFYCRCLITSYIPIVVGFIPLVLSFNIVQE